MQLDGEGRPMVRGISRLSSHQKVSPADASISLCTAETCKVPTDGSNLSMWEKRVTKLYQRVREVQDLVREDLKEIQEPLDALARSETLSQEHLTQLAVAKAYYEQACQEYTDTLERILLPFERQETDVEEVRLSESTLL